MRILQLAPVGNLQPMRRQSAAGDVPMHQMRSDFTQIRLEKTEEETAHRAR